MRSRLSRWIGRAGWSLAGVALGILAEPVRQAGGIVWTALQRQLPPSALGAMLLGVCLLAVLAWLLLLREWLARDRSPTAEADFVPEGGFWRERHTGYALCTRCASDGKRVHMLDAGGGYMCMSCSASFPKNAQK